MTSVPGTQWQSKNERRDAAREKARVLLKQQQRRSRRNRVLLQGGITVVVLAIVAVVALVILNAARPPGPGPRNMADDGIVITTGLKAQRTGALAAGADPAQRDPQSSKVAIRVYEDFGCPVCGTFEKANASYIASLVDSGRATLQIYPVSVLDRNFNGTKYSTRSANAAAAVANYSPDAFFEFHRLLYANQPAEGTDGLTEDQLIGYAKQAKVDRLGDITDAIRNRSFSTWVGDATDRFLTADYPKTDVNGPSDLAKLSNNQMTGPSAPTVFIDGKLYTGSVADADAFKSAVTSSSAVDPSASPTP